MIKRRLPLALAAAVVLVAPRARPRARRAPPPLVRAPPRERARVAQRVVRAPARRGAQQVHEGAKAIEPRMVVQGEPQWPELQRRLAALRLAQSRLRRQWLSRFARDARTNNPQSLRQFYLKPTQLATGWIRPRRTRPFSLRVKSSRASRPRSFLKRASSRRLFAPCRIALRAWRRPF